MISAGSHTTSSLTGGLPSAGWNARALNSSLGDQTLTSLTAPDLNTTPSSNSAAIHPNSTTTSTTPARRAQLFEDDDEGLQGLMDDPPEGDQPKTKDPKRYTDEEMEPFVAMDLESLRAAANHYAVRRRMTHSMRDEVDDLYYNFECSLVRLAIQNRIKPHLFSHHLGHSHRINGGTTWNNFQKYDPEARMLFDTLDRDEARDQLRLMIPKTMLPYILHLTNRRCSVERTGSSFAYHLRKNRKDGHDWVHRIKTDLASMAFYHQVKGFFVLASLHPKSPIFKQGGSSFAIQIENGCQPTQIKPQRTKAVGDVSDQFLKGTVSDNIHEIRIQLKELITVEINYLLRGRVKIAEIIESNETLSGNRRKLLELETDRHNDSPNLPPRLGHATSQDQEPDKRKHSSKRTPKRNPSTRRAPNASVSNASRRRAATPNTSNSATDRPAAGPDTSNSATDRPAAGPDTSNSATDRPAAKRKRPAPNAGNSDASGPAAAAPNAGNLNASVRAASAPNAGTWNASRRAAAARTSRDAHFLKQTAVALMLVTPAITILIVLIRLKQRTRRGSSLGDAILKPRDDCPLHTDPFMERSLNRPTKLRTSGPSPYHITFRKLCTSICKCPDNIFLREPNKLTNGQAELSQAERNYIAEKAKKSVNPWRTYLQNVQLKDFDINAFLDEAEKRGGLAGDTLPNFGLSLSGGGGRALCLSSSILQAFDSRNPRADAAKVGGILQLSNYAVGVSGASWLLGAWATSNFPPISDIAPKWRLSEQNDLWDWNVAKHYRKVYKVVKQKKLAGFPTNIVEDDPSQEDPNQGESVLWSSIAQTPLYKDRQVPYVIAVTTSRPGIKQDFTPYSPIYEYSAEEFGVFHPRLNASISMTYLGSPQNLNGRFGTCVRGYDNAGFIMGMSSNIYSMIDSPNDHKPIALKIIEKLTDDDNFEGKPERKIDAIIAVDALEMRAEHRWQGDGSHLVEMTLLPLYQGRHMPKIPSSVNGSFTQLGYHRRPTFFGCNDFKGPLIIYLPNYYAVGETNQPTSKTTFTPEEIEVFYENGFAIATQNAGPTKNLGWPACLACALIDRQVLRNSASRTAECQACFQRYCAKD
ncbi:hypothetical protein H4Q26_004153 [Puccinia striiformis f. sp. tritici PST-130]|nr:hypothetical protein H4Q26_004153 [Puccinia striiformis f. sp. tritici PST-130]